MKIIGNIPRRKVNNWTLPDGWKLVSLSDVCEIISGQSPPSSTYRKTQEGLPFFQGKADFGLIHPIPSVWCVEPKKISEPGDILISVRAPVGPTNIAVVKCCIGRGLAAIRCSEEVERDFVLSALRLFEQELVQQGTGSTFDAINRDQLEKFEIPLPPLPEQKRIAAILRERMEAVERARKSAEEQVEAATALTDAYLREIFESKEAKGWPRKVFGEIAGITAKQVDPKLPEYKDLPHVNGENVESGTCRLLYLNTAAEDGMISGKYLFEPGVVLYNKLRPYLRKVLYADFKGLCSADMYPINVSRDHIIPEFTSLMLLSEPFTKYANRLSEQARMPKLNRQQLFAWEAPCPSIKNQQEIVIKFRNKSDRTVNLISKIKDQFSTINELPGALLRQAFRGEL